MLLAQLCDEPLERGAHGLIGHGREHTLHDAILAPCQRLRWTGGGHGCLQLMHLLAAPPVQSMCDPSMRTCGADASAAQAWFLVVASGATKQACRSCDAHSVQCGASARGGTWRGGDHPSVHFVDQARGSARVRLCRAQQSDGGGTLGQLRPQLRALGLGSTEAHRVAQPSALSA